MKLATSTISASGHEPVWYSNTTPPMIVSGSVEPIAVVSITGNRLAGRKQMAAATSSAQVVSIEALRRHSSSDPQRGQCPGS